MISLVAFLFGIAFCRYVNAHFSVKSLSVCILHLLHYYYYSMRNMRDAYGCLEFEKCYHIMLFIWINVRTCLPFANYECKQYQFSLFFIFDILFRYLFLTHTFSYNIYWLCISTRSFWVVQAYISAWLSYMNPFSCAMNELWCRSSWS